MVNAVEVNVVMLKALKLVASCWAPGYVKGLGDAPSRYCQHVRVLLVDCSVELSSDMWNLCNFGLLSFEMAFRL